jgi:hypothetical protein
MNLKSSVLLTGIFMNKEITIRNVVAVPPGRFDRLNERILIVNAPSDSIARNEDGS